MSSGNRPNSMVGHVKDARPYGIGGNVPADAVMTAHRPHGRGRLYVSDVPYEQPYNERATCAGTRTDGEACKAKAKPGEAYCEHHDPTS